MRSWRGRRVRVRSRSCAIAAKSHPFGACAEEGRRRNWVRNKGIRLESFWLLCARYLTGMLLRQKSDAGDAGQHDGFVTGTPRFPCRTCHGTLPNEFGVDLHIGRASIFAPPCALLSQAPRLAFLEGSLGGSLLASIAAVWCARVEYPLISASVCSACAGPEDLTDPETPINAPRLYVTMVDATDELHLIIYQVGGDTLCFFSASGLLQRTSGVQWCCSRRLAAVRLLV